MCLAYHDQRKIPTDIEKDDLLQAGIGEKEIEIDDLDLDADEFRQQFPLSEGGCWLPVFSSVYQILVRWSSFHLPLCHLFHSLLEMPVPTFVHFNET